METVPSHKRAAQRGPRRNNAAQQHHGLGQHSRPAKLASPGHFTSIGTIGGAKGNRDRAESSIKCRDRKLRRRTRNADWHASQAQIRLTAREKAEKAINQQWTLQSGSENGANASSGRELRIFLGGTVEQGLRPGTMRERKGTS